MVFNASVVIASNRDGVVRARGGERERVGTRAREVRDEGSAKREARERKTDPAVASCRVAHRELHKNPDVVFAGYKNPHPTDHRIVLKVHTNANTTPVQALRDAVTNLRAEVSDVAQQFSDEINAIRRE